MSFVGIGIGIVVDGRWRRGQKTEGRSAVGNGVFAFWALALLDGLHTLRVLIRSLANMAKVRRCAEGSCVVP